MSPIQLIAGLGNPGKEYAHTRHNAGAWFVEYLAKLAKIQLHAESKYRGLYGIAKLNAQPIHLLIPTTFMNHCGQAIDACAHDHKITPEFILIAHDDIDLPVGTIKLKFDGGDGGHNGLKDIIRHLNTKQFHRLRIGVSHPGPSKNVEDYVLNPPSKADRQKIEHGLQQVEEVLPLILRGEMQKAMHKLHTSLI